jgi:hypothetical protein
MRLRPIPSRASNGFMAGEIRTIEKAIETIDAAAEPTAPSQRA